jgi:hypothetical protein
MLSTFDIQMVLHFNAYRSRWPHDGAPIFKERAEMLVRMGVLQPTEDEKIYRTSPLGDAFVSYWKSTLLPSLRKARESTGGETA